MQEKKFFIGIDSDGCVFNSMDIKQKECFCPQFIKHMGLEPISKYAQEAWEFVNLHSRYRGLNRFNALVKTLDLLRSRSEIRKIDITIPELPQLKKWINSTTNVCKDSLVNEIEKKYSRELSDVLAWSNSIDTALEEKASNIPVFPMVEECLKKINRVGDIDIISQTPVPIISREWEQNKIDIYIVKIFGQESGTKIEQLEAALRNKYQKEHCLMIGDAWGDFEAARKTGVSFYPINPDREIQSWQRLYDESFDRFCEGSYKGEYENELLKEFSEILPSEPDWH